ncbi:trimeric intracellular cation channel family protein, partial [Paracoccus sp. (in: a-proteobacteria)]|uniref:trimeric intracellular cation channel family protein n=1 Tax=Paracoccus sp. TaxID=267 RepID=UPI0028AAB6CE
MTLIKFIEIMAILVGAFSGFIEARRKRMDLVGVFTVAFITAFGGGTLRDLVLGRAPVFWIGRPELLLLTTVAAIVVFFTAHLLESRYRAILWLDAFALAVAVPAGVGIALEAGVSPVVTVLMGVMTGTFGGLMRDVVGNEVPLVLKQGELYVTAAFGGAVAALLLMALGSGRGWALIGCAAAVLLLRAGGIGLGWRLPVYKARPPR